MTIRTITGTINYANGSIPANSRVEFYLNGIHIDEVTIAHSAVFANVGPSGAVSVNLYPNEGGFGADRYNVDLVTYSTNQYIKEIRRVNLGQIYVEDVDGQVLQDLLALFSAPAGELSPAEQAAADAIAAAADAAASAASLSSQLPPSPFYLALGGQSNALGSDGGSGTNWITTAGKVFVWVPSTSTWADAVGRQGLEPFNLDGSNNAGVHAALAIANKFGVTVRMVLACEGSTEIEQWTGGGYALGVPRATDRTVSASNRVQFKKWTDAVTAASIPQFHAFEWWQGEADLDTPDAVYRSELDYLVGQVKSLGTAPVASRIFPAAIHGLYTGEDLSQQARRTQSLEKYCYENPDKAIYVTSENLAGRDDDLIDPDNIINHFTSAAYSIGGIRAAMAIMQMWYGNAVISDQRLKDLEQPSQGLEGTKIGSRDYVKEEINSGNSPYSLNIDANAMRGEIYPVVGTVTINLDPTANQALGEAGLGFWFYTMSNADSVTLVADNGAGTTRTIQVFGESTTGTSVTITGAAGEYFVRYIGARYEVLPFPRSAHAQAVWEAGSNTSRRMISPQELNWGATARANAIVNAAIIDDDVVTVISTDAGGTITVPTKTLLHTGTLTNARTVTFSNTNARGSIMVSRTGAGAFNLAVRDASANLLQNLTTGQWLRATFNGTAWVKTASGTI